MIRVKPILDACCGGKMFYFNKSDDRVLFQDIRKIKTTLCDGRTFEVNPDVQCDFTNMPYKDGTFSMVVFDPPHLKYTGSKKELNGYQMIKYGFLPSDWQDILSKGFKECFRVLKSGGFLIFKWNETDIKVSEILKLTPEKPVFGHISGKRSNTHWICFMKSKTIIDKAATDSCVIDNGIINPQIVPVYEQGFRDGARWLKRNTWNNVSEEPTEKRKLVVIDSIGEISESNFMPEFESWQEYVKEAEIEKWCYKEDLIPTEE